MFPVLRENTIPLEPGRKGVDYKPVITPNGSTLDFKVVGGVKVYHLTAEEVNHEFAPGLRARCWGYNAFGQLGNGGLSNASVPTAIQGDITFQKP